MAAMNVLRFWNEKIESDNAGSDANGHQNQIGRKATIDVNRHCNEFTLNVILSVAFGVERPWADSESNADSLGESSSGLSELRKDIQLVMANLSCKQSATKRRGERKREKKKKKTHTHPCLLFNQSAIRFLTSFFFVFAASRADILPVCILGLPSAVDVAQVG